MTLIEAFHRIAPGDQTGRITVSVRKLAGGEIQVTYTAVIGSYTSVATSLDNVVAAACGRKMIMPDDLEDEERLVADAAKLETVTLGD